MALKPLYTQTCEYVQLFYHVACFSLVTLNLKKRRKDRIEPVAKTWLCPVQFKAPWTYIRGAVTLYCVCITQKFSNNQLSL